MTTTDEPGLYAYVYPNDNSKIYLGQEFGHAPVSGYDSTAGTLAHEISHFNDVGGTDDHVYGQVGAIRLADQSSDKALDNADNYQYFIESDSRGE